MQQTWMNNSLPNTVPPGGYNCYGGNVPPYATTPVSTAIYGTTATCSWAHTVPSPMPWVHNPDMLPPDPCTSQTATNWELHHNFNNNTNAHLQLKRKSEPEILGSVPLKQCATEERMAARFREMHISNQFAVPTENTFTVPEKSITNLEQFDHLLKTSEAKDNSSTKSLVLAPELRNLVEPGKMLINTFLNKVERPSMALVVWQPPNPLLSRSEEQQESSINNNNNEFLPSLNPRAENIVTLFDDDDKMDT